MQPEDPPFLTVGTEVSAKYKGAFCEAKVHKVVKVVKVKVTFKLGLGSAVVSDDQVKGVLKIGAQVKASHPDKSQYVDAIINKIQDCSQYTVVFDDGDITTLRRTSLCLKSGRHFAESETLDQLPLTHPEHFGTPVGGNRRGRRSRQNPDGDDSGDEEDDNVHKRHRSRREEWEADIGKVVCVELGDKKKMKDNWFPGLVVAPTAQDSVKIETKKDYLVRSFQDGRYYTVPKKEASPFSREVGNKVSQSALKTAVEKALLFMTNDELPPHWDRDLLFGMDVSDEDSDRDGSDSDSSDDEPREEKDHFVAQLYKFMEECGTPINTGPTVGNKDLDLYKLFKVVQKLGGFNRVMNQNTWKNVSTKMQLQTLGSQAPNHIKNAYKKYLQSFEDFYRKLGCTMVSNPRGSRTRHRSGRSLIRDCDRTPRTLKKKENDSCDSTEDETEKKDEEEEKESKKPEVKKEKEETTRREVKRELEKKEPEKKESDKKETEKKEPEKKKEKEESKVTKPVKQEVNKSPEREPRSIRERSREPLLTREKSREPAVTRERSREPMAAKDKSREKSREPTREKSREPTREKSREPTREKSREPATSRERNRDSASVVKDVPSEPVTPKEKREPRTPRSEAKTRAAVKTEAIEVKTRSSVKEEKAEVIEVKTRSSVKEEIKKEDIKKEEKEASDEEEEEIEMAQTRASRQREEKASTPTRKAKIERAASVSSSCTPSSTQSDNTGNDDKAEDIDVVSMSSTSSGPLLSSVSAPSPSNSSGTPSDKKAINNKNNKSKSAKPTVVPPNPSVPLEDPNLRKRGRKKKQDGDVEHTVVYPYRGKALIPAHVPVSVGDKLRVLYGPNAKESKVTYEAKVLQVDEEGNSSMYYVHYLGWNTRYDEWVGRQRIAENTTWSQNRARKGRAAATKELKEKKEKAKEKGVKKEDKDNVAAVPSPKGNLNKRGRSGTVIRERRESERSDVSGTSSISGPSTRATKERSLVQPDSPSSVDSKRTRRSVQDTADSDSEEYESDVDTGSEKSRTRVSVERRMNTLSTSSASSTPTSEPCLATGSYVEKPTKEAKLKTPPIEIKKEEEEGEEAKPCGKDIDLNAIMSEMKGLDKPIKKEEDRTVKEMPPRIISAPVVLMPFASPEKKSVETPVKKSLESMPKKSESPSKPVAQEPVKLLKLESLEDDIYEFKEPEPFDIGEMRARKETRTKNSIVVGAEEQTDCEKFKKKARTRKDGDVERNESDSDNNLSCQKKLVLTRESPSKRVLGDSKESVSGLDGSATPEKKESAAASQPVITTPGKVTSIVKKDTPVKLEPNIASLSEVKIVKPEMPKCPSPKLVLGEMPKSPSPLKEPIRVAGTPVKTKTLAGVEKAGVSSHKPVGASSHILAQAVMPIIESKALAKPIPKPSFEPKLEKVPQVKVEEKVEPKVMSFSQRQQQIFPHLLNRPETTEKVKERVMASPMQSPSRDTSAQDNSVSNISSSDVDRIKRESSVEESIEAVVKRARQDQNEKLDESDKSETKSSPDKRRRTSNRVKKAISREFLPDTSEESDSDCRNPRLDAERRMRRGKMGPDGEKISPMKRVYKPMSETEKKKEKRDDDDMDDEDADEDDDMDDERGSVMRVIGKSGVFKKEENKTGNDEKKDVEEEEDEEEDEEEVESHLSRKKPRASASATPKRLEDEETETGLGDLLCEETIPPGSPMTHDPITADVDTPQRQDIKNEMPFASVPTGSSFGKRGPAPAAQQHSSQSQLPVSQQQQPPSVPPPPPPPPSVHLKPTLKQPTPVKSPQIIVPQTQPSQKVEPHHTKQQQPQAQQQKHLVQPQHIQTPQQQQQQQIRQNPQQPPQQSLHQRQPPQPQTSPIQHQQPHHHMQSQQQQHLQPLQQQQGKSQSQQDHLLPHQHTLKLHPHVHHQEHSHEPSTPQHQQSIDYQLQISSRHNPNVSSAIQSHNLNVVAAVAAAAASSRGVSSASSSILSTTAPSTSAAECGNMAASRNIRPSQNTVLDNTPPTTPESIISNLSDSPRGGDEGPKIDESSKSGRDSSEVELDSLADNSKMDQFSEDSNTMDSTLGSDSRHMRGVMKRQHDDHLDHDEVSETEESNNSSSASKRRRRGPRVHAGNEGDDNDGRKMGSHGSCPGRRRRRHSSSRGGLPVDDDPETSGLSALSLACSAARRSRYNFCQELDPDLDASKRIAVLQSRIQELKRTYMQVKTELASVERRRKKLRRKEREKDAKSEPT